MSVWITVNDDKIRVPRDVTARGREAVQKWYDDKKKVSDEIFGAEKSKQPPKKKQVAVVVKPKTQGTTERVGGDLKEE